MGTTTLQDSRRRSSSSRQGRINTMTGTAVVLGAGGPVASMQHLGLLLALADSGFDLTDASMVVATSAGAGVAAGVLSGAGLEQTQRWATTPPTDEDRARFMAAMRSGGLARFRPMSPLMLRHLAGGGKGLNLALTGVLPTGRLPTTAMSRFLDDVAPFDWPATLRVPATRLRDGQRVVFGPGSDVTLADALEATAAVPGFFVPKSIGTERYVDGAVFSANSADLVAATDAGTVIVSSVQTRAGSSPLRRVARARLRSELSRLDGRKVVLVEPGPEMLALLPGFPRKNMDVAPKILAAARQQAERALA